MDHDAADPGRIENVLQVRPHPGEGGQRMNGVSSVATSSPVAPNSQKRAV
jgi:hypothetical protein